MNSVHLRTSCHLDYESFNLLRYGANDIPNHHSGRISVVYYFFKLCTFSWSKSSFLSHYFVLMMISHLRLYQMQTQASHIHNAQRYLEALFLSS